MPTTLGSHAQHCYKVLGQRGCHDLQWLPCTQTCGARDACVARPQILAEQILRARQDLQSWSECYHATLVGADPSSHNCQSRFNDRHIQYLYSGAESSTVLALNLPTGTSTVIESPVLNLVLSILPALHVFRAANSIHTIMFVCIHVMCGCGCTGTAVLIIIVVLVTGGAESSTVHAIPVEVEDHNK